MAVSPNSVVWATQVEPRKKVAQTKSRKPHQVCCVNGSDLLVFNFCLCRVDVEPRFVVVRRMDFCKGCTHLKSNGMLKSADLRSKQELLQTKSDEIFVGS